MKYQYLNTKYCDQAISCSTYPYFRVIKIYILVILFSLGGYAHGSDEIYPIRSADSNQLKLVAEKPLHYSLSRVSFLGRSLGDQKQQSLYFSTLEKYEYENSQGFLVEVSLDSFTVTNSLPFFRSVELRSICHEPTQDLTWLGASLYPQLYKFEDTSSPSHLTKVVDFSPETEYGWTQQIGCGLDGTVWSISSQPKSHGISEWLVGYNSHTEEEHRVTLEPSMTTGSFGGVESVDPSGRVWFFRTFGDDYQPFWYSPSSKLVEKAHIPNYPDHTPHNWFEWGKTEPESMVVDLSPSTISLFEWEQVQTDETTHTFIRVNRENLKFIETVELPETYKNLTPIFVGRNRRQGNSIYYMHKISRNVFLVDGRKKEILTTDWKIPKESGVQWLGISKQSKLIGWKAENKQIVTVMMTSDGETHTQINHVDHRNASPADIIGLVVDDVGEKIFGGGMQTLDMFQTQLKSGKTINLGWSIPGSIGELHNMLNFENNIYFVAYINSTIGIYNPSAPWNPGKTNSSNPRNFGPLGNYNQQISYGSAIDAQNRKIYFTSYSSYSGTPVQALAILDVDTQTVKTFNTKDHRVPNFATQYDQFDLDPTGNLLMLIESPTGHQLARLTAGDFSILSKSVDITPTSKFKFHHASNRILLAQGSKLFWLSPDLKSMSIAGSLDDEVVRIITNSKHDLAILTNKSIIHISSDHDGELIAFPEIKSGLWSWQYRPAVMDDMRNVFFARGPDLYRQNPPNELKVKIGNFNR